LPGKPSASIPPAPASSSCSSSMKFGLGAEAERAKVCRRAAFTRLVLRLKASPSRFTAGLAMRVATRLEPVSNGLFLRL
jgi:hypothetical protein